VIMEYLDEVYPPSLHPADPLRKAHNRAWIEFASTFFTCLFNMVMAPQQEACDSAERELREKLALVDKQLVGPFFNGEEFSLVDAAYAPLFMRLALLEQWCPMGLLEGMEKMQAWSEKLLARPSVQNSAVAELPQLYRGHISSSGGYGAERFGE
jgi:glutathione S-transferase